MSSSLKPFFCGVAVLGLAACSEPPEAVEYPAGEAHCVDAKASRHIDLVATSSGLILGRAERPAPGTATPLYDPVFNHTLGARLKLENGYAVVDYGRKPVEKYICASQSLTIKP